MNYAKIFTAVCACLIAFNAQATNKHKKEVLTLSGGKYVEVFDQDSVEQIGSILYNVNSEKIVGFVKSEDSADLRPSLKPEVMSRWLSPDPLARKYPSISPYVFCADNPIQFKEVDGRYFVDAKGHKINVAFSEGNIHFSKNASSDLVNLGGAMIKTATGTSVFNAMAKANYPIAVHLNTTDELTAPNGGTYLGLTKTTPLGKTGQIKSVDITIYEKAFTDNVVNGKMSLQGNDVNVSGLSKTELEAGGLVHEGTHATDKQSNSILNKKGTSQERETKPYQNQENYYQELEQQQTQPTNSTTPPSNTNSPSTDSPSQPNSK